MLEEGCTCCREWTNNNFTESDKKAKDWSDVWSHATGIDYEVGVGKPVDDIMTLLATNDKCEISLRALASRIYLRKTGDRNGAEAMLAIKTPGSSRDVAPGWLVDEVTSLSRADYNRNQLVKAAPEHGHGGYQSGRNNHRGGGHTGGGCKGAGDGGFPAGGHHAGGGGHGGGKSRGKGGGRRGGR